MKLTLIHASQEYRTQITYFLDEYTNSGEMLVPSALSKKDYHKIFYTGVTRAKKSLIIVGDPNSFIYGINNDYVDGRKTTLKDFIINKYNY